jgi:hypothetical protein
VAVGTLKLILLRVVVVALAATFLPFLENQAVAVVQLFLLSA